MKEQDAQAPSDLNVSVSPLENVPTNASHLQIGRTSQFAGAFFVLRNFRSVAAS
jgi:hypothetical protein